METNKSNRYTPETFWQNFRLGTELDIAGNFIFNSLESFNKIRVFLYSDDVFEVLYNLSVGIERLMKVSIVLLEFKSETNITEFEKSLKTHNHSELFNRIKKNKTQIKSNKELNSLLSLLTNFYKNIRYDRFTLESVYSPDKDKKALTDFFRKFVPISYSDEYLKNTKYLKKFLGKTVYKLTSQLYEIIKNEAQKKNIFTYELRYNSKAGRIFLQDELYFENDNIIRKEILLSLISNLPKDIVESIKALKLESVAFEDYIRALFSFPDFAEIVDEVNTIYADDLQEVYKYSHKERIELMENFEHLFDNNDEDEFFE